MEIPDVIVVNKSDHPLTDTMVREIRGVLTLAPQGSWPVPIVKTEAHRGEGVEELAEKLAEHRAHVEAEGTLSERRRRNLHERGARPRDRAPAARAGGDAARGRRGRASCSTRSWRAGSTRRARPARSSRAAPSRPATPRGPTSRAEPHARGQARGRLATADAERAALWRRRRLGSRDAARWPSPARARGRAATAVDGAETCSVGAATDGAAAVDLRRRAGGRADGCRRRRATRLVHSRPFVLDLQPATRLGGARGAAASCRQPGGVLRVTARRAPAGGPAAACRASASRCRPGRRLRPRGRRLPPAAVPWPPAEAAARRAAAGGHADADARPRRRERRGRRARAPLRAPALPRRGAGLPQHERADRLRRAGRPRRRRRPARRRHRPPRRDAARPHRDRRLQGAAPAPRPAGRRARRRDGPGADRLLRPVADPRARLPHAGASARRRSSPPPGRSTHRRAPMR